jgi:hypothetical protein
VLAIVEEEGAQRGLCVEAVAVGRRADHRLDRQRPGDGALAHASVPRRRPGDDLPDDHGHRSRRGDAESLPCPHGQRRPGADAGHPSSAARGADARRAAAAAGPRRILAVHRNAQRLLKPVPVVNPYARELTFHDSQTRTRRDHMKYLTLIRSIACCISISGHERRSSIAAARSSTSRSR